MIGRHHRLPKHPQDQPLTEVAAVEEDDRGESLFLEAHVDAWLADRYAAIPGRQERVKNASKGLC